MLLTPFISSCFIMPVEDEIMPPPLIRAYEGAAHRFSTVGRGDLIQFKDIAVQLAPLSEERLAFTASRVSYSGIYAAEGDVVQVGDLLAELEVDDLVRSLDTALYNMERQLMALRHAGERFELEAAYNNNADSGEFDKTVNNIYTQINFLQIDIDKIQNDINERRIYATMDGIVSFVKDIGDNELSMAGETIITITEKAPPLYLLRGIDTSLFEPGDTVDIRLGGSAMFTSALVLSPDQTGILTPEEGALYFLLDDESAISSTYATIRLVEEERYNTLFLPFRAVTTIGDSSHVYIFENNTRSMKFIRTGIRDSMGNIEIIDGLEEGEAVLIS